MNENPKMAMFDAVAIALTANRPMLQAKTFARP